MQLLQRPPLHCIARTVRNGPWTMLEEVLNWKKCFDTTILTIWFSNTLYLTISCPCIVCIFCFWCWSWWWTIVIWFLGIWSCSACASDIFKLKYLVYYRVYCAANRWLLCRIIYRQLTRAYSLSNSSLAVPSSFVKLTYPTHTQQTPFIIIGDLNQSLPGSFSKSQNSFGGIIPWTFSNAKGKKWSLFHRF